MKDEPQTTDTFTDAMGQRYIAGQAVPEAAWERFAALEAEVKRLRDDLDEQRGNAEGFWEDREKYREEAERLRVVAQAARAVRGNDRAWTAVDYDAYATMQEALTALHPEEPRRR